MVRLRLRLRLRYEFIAVNGSHEVGEEIVGKLVCGVVAGTTKSTTEPISLIYLPPSDAKHLRTCLESPFQEDFLFQVYAYTYSNPLLTPGWCVIGIYLALAPAPPSTLYILR